MKEGEMAHGQTCQYVPVIGMYMYHASILSQLTKHCISEFIKMAISIQVSLYKVGGIHRFKSDLDVLDNSPSDSWMLLDAVGLDVVGLDVLHLHSPLNTIEASDWMQLDWM